MIPTKCRYLSFPPPPTIVVAPQGPQWSSGLLSSWLSSVPPLLVTSTPLPQLWCFAPCATVTGSRRSYNARPPTILAHTICDKLLCRSSIFIFAAQWLVGCDRGGGGERRGEVNRAAGNATCRRLDGNGLILGTVVFSSFPTQIPRFVTK